MTSNGSKDLGSIRNPDKNQRPCIECHKRRIKCDLAKPYCGKCQKKNIECHYKKHRRFINKYSQQASIEARSNENYGETEIIEYISQTPLLSRQKSFNEEIFSYEVHNKKTCSEPLPNHESIQNADSLLDTEIDTVVGTENLGNIDQEYYHILRIPLNDYFQSTVLGLSNSINFLNENHVTSHYFINGSLIFSLFNYFNEVILDQMVPYDNTESPYRKFLIPCSQKSEDMLLTLICISSEHLHTRGLLSVDILNSLNSSFSVILDSCFLNLSNANEWGNRSFIEDDNILSTCLNLLMQISYSIFSCDHTDIHMRHSKLRNYLKLVNEVLLRLNPSLQYHSTYRIFIVQRLVFNDVFISSLNNSEPMVPRLVLDHLLDIEKSSITPNLEDKLSMLNIIGCPIEILSMIYDIQVKYFDVEEKIITAGKSDENIVSISKMKAELELYFSNVLESYSIKYLTKTIRGNTSEERKMRFLSLSNIYYHTAWILLLRKISHEDARSMRMIYHVDKIIEIITKDILIGSGPDTCIAFPLYIAGREATLKAHKTKVLEFFDLSEWHLNLGSQRLVRRLLCEYYWVETPNDPGELQKKIAEEFPFIIY